MQSVHRAFDLVETVGRHGELGVSELARLVGLPVSTTHSLIRTLAERHYLIGNRGRYRLGPGVTALSSLYDPIQSLAAVTQHALTRLAERTRLAATATVLVGREARSIGFAPSPQAVASSQSPTVWTKAFSVGIGRLLVALTAERDWGRFIAEQGDCEPTWSQQRWLTELRTIAKRHYATKLTRDPRSNVAMVVPVWGSDGAVVAGIGVSCPAFLGADLFSQDQLDRLWLTTTELSTELGCTEFPDPPVFDPRLLAAVSHVRQPV